MQNKEYSDSAYVLEDGTPIWVPCRYWYDLAKRNINELCRLTGFDFFPPNILWFRFLNKDIRVDIENRQLELLNANAWEKTTHKLLELVVLLYLNGVNAAYPLGKDIVSAKDLKEGHFFKGVHDLKTAPLVKQFGDNINGFKKTAEYLGGRPVAMADAAYRFWPFPKVPLYYLFWKGDEDFAPNMSVLFDRSIEAVLPSSGIWGLVDLVSSAIQKGAD